MTVTPAEFRIILLGALLALFLAALDQTIVATALPAMGADLGDFHLIGWVVTSYMLTATAGTPVLGKLGDIYGRRRLLMVSMALFLVASALCALSQTMMQLILARAVQGVAGGGLMTTVQALIGDLASPRERAKYVGYFSMTWAAAALAGPILGGFFAAYISWHWVFWINLPLGLVAMVVVHRALRKVPLTTRPAKIDVLSILWLLLGAGGVLVVVSEGGATAGWGWPVLSALAVGGVTALILFLRRQGRIAEPILPLPFLREAVIGPMLAAIFIVFGAYLAVAILAPTYLQVALGAAPDVTGLLMIPFMLSATLAAGMTGRYVKQTGRYRLPCLIGIPLAATALLIQGALAGHLPVWAAAALLVPVGLGIGPIFPVTILATQNAVERRDIGAITGAMGFVRSLGGAMLTALATALLLGLIVRWVPDLAALGGLDDLARRPLSPAGRQSVADAFAVLFWVLGALMLAGLWVFSRAEERPLRGES